MRQDTPFGSAFSPVEFFVVIAGVVAVVVIGIFVARAVIRAMYRAKVGAFGWDYEPSPGLETVYGLNCPPFGLGRQRRVEDRITGRTASGVDFVAVRYRSDVSGWQFVAALDLGAAYPEAQLAPAGRERRGVAGQRLDVDGWSVVGADATWTQAVAASVPPAAHLLRKLLPSATLSVDGRRLTVAPVPSDPELLLPVLNCAAEIVAIIRSLPAGAPGPVPAELSFYGRPTWIYRPQDDAWLASVPFSGAGHAHEAKEVIIGRRGALQLVAFTHHWDTTETRTTTDANGNSHIETYTAHHTEPAAAIFLDFPFRDLSLNWGMFGGRLGRKIAFESEDFNRRYRVNADDDRFAYDVIHPQQMEWLLAIDAPAFSIDSGRMDLVVPDTDFPTLDDRLNFAAAFFGRLRPYTWESLGLRTPPALS